MEAKKIFDFTKINQLLFVCKSLGAGRQYRVLKNIYLKLLLVSHIHLIQVSMVSLSLIDIIGWKMKKSLYDFWRILEKCLLR